MIDGLQDWWSNQYLANIFNGFGDDVDPMQAALGGQGLFDSFFYQKRGEIMSHEIIGSFVYIHC